MSEWQNHNILPPKAVNRLDKKIDTGLRRFFKVASKKPWEKFYGEAQKQAGKPIQGDIRKTVKGYQALLGFEDSERPKPELNAIEQGLTFGAYIGKLTLSNVQYIEFTSIVRNNLSALRQNAPQSPFDLSDVMRLQGRKFADRLMLPFYPALNFANPHNNELAPRENDLFYCSIGYMGTTALTLLTEAEIKRVSRVDRGAEHEIRGALDQLISSDFEIPIEKIMPE